MTTFNPGYSPVTAKMNPDIKAKWVAALRSGRYRQGTDTLANIGDGTPTYCCLGVLCDLALKSGDVSGVEVSNTYSYHLEADVRVYNSATSIPPLEISEWAGLEDSNPTVRVKPGSEAKREVQPEPVAMLAELNDGSELKNIRKHTFAEIADYIEENL